eukprot:m.65752 g.65752  ORF g.65752 m.65752 type:complete len:145 (+) comp35326_c0_seq24:82-516(+)
MTLFPRPLSLDVVCRTASEPTAALKSTCRTLHPLPPTASRRFRKMAETTESPGGLQGYLVSFINDSILLTSAIDPFQSEYLDIVKRLENGREFANHALGFWRKLSKLQNTFAKGCECKAYQLAGFMPRPFLCLACLTSATESAL